MGAHDSAENVPSIADYLSAGELLPLVMLLTFDESAAFSTEACNVLIARIGRTSIKATYSAPSGDPDAVALHVHESIEGAQECHRLSIDQLMETVAAYGYSAAPI